MSSSQSTHSITTTGGALSFPAFFPVTTFGGKFPLDSILRPYLASFSRCVMVSHHYAQKMKTPAAKITFMDSGGFASLFKGASSEDLGDRMGIRINNDSLLDPQDVLAFQSRHAQIAATVDFIIPPDASGEDAKQRQADTLLNALWAIGRIDSDLRLFASIQAWDADSATRLTAQLAEHPFAGFALGGMIPRLSQPKTIFDIVEGIRRVDSHRPLHVFGIGSPRLIRALFDHGVDSVDSSSYVRSAVSKRYLDPRKGDYIAVTEVANPADTCPCRVCQTFDTKYLQLEGELNTMALALHNLAATMACLRLNPCPNAPTSA